MSVIWPGQDPERQDQWVIGVEGWPTHEVLPGTDELFATIWLDFARLGCLRRL